MKKKISLKSMGELLSRDEVRQVQGGGSYWGPGVQCTNLFQYCTNHGQCGRDCLCTANQCN